MQRGLPNPYVVAFIGFLTLLLPAVCGAQEPVRLVYRLGPQAEECPGELELRAAVRVRLARDPFLPDAGRTVRAVVQGENGQLVGRIELIGADGMGQGTREHRAALGDCGELVRALALSISIAVDPAASGVPPEQAGHQAPVDAPAARAGDPTRAEPPPTDATRDRRSSTASSRPGRPSPRHPWTPSMGGSVHGAAGSLPSFAWGVALTAAARRGDVSVELTGRVDWPTRATPAGSSGEVDARLYLLSVAPCVHFDPVFLCPLGAAGAFSAASAGITEPRRDRTFYAGLGGRAGVLWDVSPAVALRLHVDGLGTLTRVRLRLDEDELWRAPPSSVSGAVGALVRFP